MRKKTLDRWGGIGSILTGTGCLWIMRMDAIDGHSIWKVWAVMSAVLVINGVAMIRHSNGPSDVHHA